MLSETKIFHKYRHKEFLLTGRWYIETSGKYWKPMYLEIKSGLFSLSTEWVCEDDIVDIQICGRQNARSDNTIGEVDGQD